MTLLLLELEYFFFDCAFADKPDDQDVLALTNTMRTAHGLVFNSGVPPVIEEDDTVGCSEVKAYTSSLETDEEDSDGRIGLELMNGCFAVAGVAIEGDETDVF